MPKQRRRGHGEGSIYQRKDGRWVAEVTLDDGKRKQLYAKTQAEAVAKRNKVLLDQQQGILAKGPKQTVKQYVEYWLEDVHRATLKISTYALYRRHLNNHIIPELGHIQLQKLTVDQIQALYAKKLREGLSANTIRLIHTILRTALKDAVKWKRIPINICDAVSPPRSQRHEILPLDQNQAHHLLEAAKGNRLEALLTLAITTGMRLGEILALRWINIDFEKKTLQVLHTVDFISGFGHVEGTPKTESSRRSITLPQVTIESLKQHRTYQLEARLKAGTRWKEQGLVFPHRYGGYFSRYILYTIFKKLLKDAELPHMRFHDLRHNAATILLSMGVPAKTVQEILGHANISITMNLYGHVFPSTHKDAMDDMDDFFGHP